MSSGNHTMISAHGNNIKTRIIIGCTFTLICCLMPALLLFFLGYRNSSNWNGNSIRIHCKITDSEVTKDTCHESCHCMYINDIWTCRTCYYEYIDVAYHIDNETYHSTIEVYDHEKDKKRLVNKNYPINDEITCYCNRENHRDVRIGLKNTIVSLAFFIIFCCLGGLALISQIVFEMYKCKE